jgi:nucleoside-diphosphate-sugar epimerase
MRILVTGSAGFIGRSLCRKLLEENHFVFGLDVIETPIKHQYFKSLIGDITDSRYIDPDYGASDWWSEIDFVFHLAAMANVDEIRTQREKAFKVNLLGTFNIVEACRKNDIPMAIASTACVYGHTKQHPSTEDGETLPVDWYGVTKRAGEEIVKGLLKRWLILRFGTTYGPEMRPALCTYIFLDQAIKKQKFTIRGSGEQTRNWIYIDDLIDGCIKAMDWRMSSASGQNGIFNLTGTESFSVRDLATICSIMVNGGLLFEENIEYSPERPDDVFIENISNEKARKLLIWNPKTELYEGMKKIYEEWMKDAERKKIV